MAAGAVAALVLWALVDPVAGLEPTVRTAGSVQRVGPGMTVVAGLSAGLAAWALLAILERLLKRPALTWTVIAVAVLALSLTGPLGSAVDTATALTLAGMHLVVAAVVIPGLARSARGR